MNRIPIPLIDARGAAEQLNVTPSRVRQLAQSKQLPGIKIGGSWCFDQREIERFQRVPVGRPLVFSLTKQLSGECDK